MPGKSSNLPITTKMVEVLDVRYADGETHWAEYEKVVGATHWVKRSSNDKGWRGLHWPNILSDAQVTAMHLGNDPRG
jgi:hypothetical protein